MHMGPFSSIDRHVLLRPCKYNCFCLLFREESIIPQAGIVLPKSSSLCTRYLARINLTGVHFSFSGVRFSVRLGRFQMKDHLSLWLATYKKPEPLTLSGYGNLSLKSCCRMCKKNGPEPCQSLVPSGFRKIKTLRLVSMHEPVWSVFLQSQALLSERKFLSRKLWFFITRIHSAGSFPRVDFFFFFYPSSSKNEDNVFRILKMNRW